MIREEFVEFIKCESTSAQYLTNKITQAVKNLSLNMGEKDETTEGMCLIKKGKL